MDYLSCFSGLPFIFRKYMQKGISVWLDVPLEALARRIAAVGTESRPLLHQESGDAYAKVGRRFIHHTMRLLFYFKFVAFCDNQSLQI